MTDKEKNNYYETGNTEQQILAEISGAKEETLKIILQFILGIKGSSNANSII